jgi:hypothetical protein
MSQVRVDDCIGTVTLGLGCPAIDDPATQQTADRRHQRQPQALKADRDREDFRLVGGRGVIAADAFDQKVLGELHHGIEGQGGESADQADQNAIDDQSVGRAKDRFGLGDGQGAQRFLPLSFSGGSGGNPRPVTR